MKQRLPADERRVLTEVDTLNSDVWTDNDDFASLEGLFPHLACVLFSYHWSDVRLDTACANTLRLNVSACMKCREISPTMITIATTSKPIAPSGFLSEGGVALPTRTIWPALNVKIGLVSTYGRR